MANSCIKHSFEVAAGVCRQCQNSYCAECLVYALGPKKPPYCVTCALSAAGVRHRGAASNPRLRKKGLFGKRVLVEDEPRRELGFDDINIQLPNEAQSTPMMARTTRREAPAELVAAVAAAEPSDTVPAPNLAVDPEPIHADAQPDVLADWASSVTAPADDAPSTGIAAWPEFEQDSGTSF